MHTHIPTFHVCVRVDVRTCVRGFVFVNNSGLLSVQLACWDPIPSGNTCACACARVHVFTGARKYVHVHDEIILLWRLSTPVLLCVRHILAYRTLDRKCIYPQHFCSSFSVYEILYSTELLRKFREIVMSFFRKQSTQTCANGFSNIGEFCKIVTLLMSE